MCEDIEDICFDLKNGRKTEEETSLLQRSATDCGIIEVSRREDAATALDVIWKPLVLRTNRNIRYNALIGKKYLLDLSDPNWRVLVLWTKDPGRVAEHLTRVEESSGKTLMDSWPVIYAVITINGHRPELETLVKPNSMTEILEGLQTLGDLLKVKHGVNYRDCMYIKVADPFVHYKTLGDSSSGKILNNWEDLGIVFSKMKEMGFRRAHYGALDLRGKWVRAIDMARDDHKIELIPFDLDGKGRDIKKVVSELSKIAHCHGISLATCGDPKRIRSRFRLDDGSHTKRIRLGICLSLSSINKLLNKVGEATIPANGSTTPKGSRKCDCQKTADIGCPAKWSPNNDREACHSCVYCFVRSKSTSATKRKK